MLIHWAAIIFMERSSTDKGKVLNETCHVSIWYKGDEIAGSMRPLKNKLRSIHEYH